MNKIKIVTSILATGLFCLTTMNAQDISTYPLEKGDPKELNKNDIVLRAIDHLTDALEETNKIEDLEIKRSIMDPLMSCLRNMRKSFFTENKDYDKISAEAIALYENFGEIASECPYKEHVEKISDHICEMVTELDNL